MATRALSYNHP
jgi:translation initiation factor 6